MNIVSKPTLLNYVAKYPDASNALLSWYKVFSKAAFNNFNELKIIYSSASIVGNNRVILNIKGNSYRLILGMDFKRQSSYIIWFGSHKEYDKIDATTVAYTEI